jgi:uncharacterized protein
MQSLTWKPQPTILAGRVAKSARAVLYLFLGLAIAIITASCAAALAQPSFDCARAQSPLERRICANPSLATLDAGLSNAFRDAQRAATSPAARDALLADQRRWLAGCAVACDGAAAADQGKPSESESDPVADCLERIYLQRIAVLDYEKNKAEWPRLPFRPVLLEGTGTSLCDDLLRDFEASFLGPSLFLDPLGEREIGFAPTPIPGAEPTPLRAEFDPYNHRRPVLVLKWVFDNGGLHLATIRYRRFASSRALATVLREPYATVNLFEAGGPVVDTDALPPPDTGQRQIEAHPYFTRSPVLSVDETPHYFRYAGRVYVLAPLQPAAKGTADTGVYELSGPAKITRRCLFQAHFPMAYYPYDAPELGAGAEATGVGHAAGPLLPAGRVCETAGDAPRTFWDHETYRPWVLERRSLSVPGIDPPGLARYLRNRGLTGLEQHRAYRRYVEVRGHAIEANARYFVDRFARPIEPARRLAALQIDWGVIDGSMIFSHGAETTALLAEDFESGHALQAAAFEGDTETVKHLLGSDPKAAALHAATVLDEPLVSDALEYPELVRALLDAGLDPNETGASGRTALMVAARLDLIDAARLLLERGVAVDTGASDKVAELYPQSDDVQCRDGGQWEPNDTPGRTALSYAAESASPPMVRLLLDHGADPDQGDREGRPPRAYTEQRDDKDRVSEIIAILNAQK